MPLCVDLGGRRIIKKNLFFKQKTAYEILRSDWSSDVCSSDLAFPSLNFADFPRIRGSFGAQFRPISSQNRADSCAAVPPAVPGGTTARQRYYRWGQRYYRQGRFFRFFFLFLGSFLAFPLWFESFLGVPYVYDIDKLPQQRIINAKRRRHQGLDQHNPL